MQVCSKVDRNKAKFLRVKIITTKWIDANAGDDHFEISDLI